MEGDELRELLGVIPTASPAWRRRLARERPRQHVNRR